MKRIIINGFLAGIMAVSVSTFTLAQTENSESKLEFALNGDAVYQIKLQEEGDEVSVVLKGDANVKDIKMIMDESVRTTISDLAVAMKKEIAEIRTAEKNGLMTKQEMADAISRVANEYTQDIEMEVERFNKSSRMNVKTEVEYHLTDTVPDQEERSIRIKVKGNPKSPKRTYHGFGLAFGWHAMILENAKVEGSIYPDIDFWRGGFSEIAYMANTRLGSSRSPLYLNYGASLLYNRADISGGDYFLQGRENPMFVDRQLDVRKSSLRTAYVNGTIGFKLAPGKRKGFHIEGNAYGGVLFRSKQDIEYRSEMNETVTEERKGRYGINRFNYGVSGGIGYNWVTLYARYDLSSLFNNNSVYDYTPISVGFRFNLM